MKYGETLRQRSIPAWSHHNIDYDDIKHFIKENTTPGKGKSVSVPGRGDDVLLHFENSLFHILADQHQRIDLFVRSKAGEIQRRIDHSKKQLRQLAVRQKRTAASRIPVPRLERYSKLEDDVIKAGEEIKSLARFTATQRTAFRKLLKKYKKWTGSANLEDRFRDEVLEDPKSFTRLDLGPMLDDYSATQQSIRALYERQVQQSVGIDRTVAVKTPSPDSSAIRQLHEAVQTGSKVFFDTSLATVPLGPNGTFASYFVHPENVVELQMLLLQYSRFYLSRSRSSSLATPVTAESAMASFGSAGVEVADYHILAADNLDRFVEEQSALTVDDREHRPGSFPQKAKACVRWSNTEDALACLRSRCGKTKSAYLKKKHIQDFFDKDAEFSTKHDAMTLADSAETVEELRRELLKDEIEPLFHYSSCRSRVVGVEEDSEGMVLATLDTGISIEKAGTGDKNRTLFPFALLLVRQEGTPKTQLLSALDNSYLVERIRGFSLEYHSVYQTCRPSGISPPFWLPILERDIRKLPPPAMKRTSTTEGSASGAQSAASNGSITEGTRSTDSTTAVETSVRFQSPPSRSSKKKQRRSYAREQQRQRQRQQQQQQQQRYWSEYDHPEEGDADAEAFVIYIDPNEQSVLDRFFDRLGAMFRGKRHGEEGPLLPTSSASEEDEPSSDDESSPTATKTKLKSFGTFQNAFGAVQQTQAASIAQKHKRERTSIFFSQLAATCYVASLAILLVAYMLRATGRHKLIREVHYGVLFATICSLAFVMVGFMSVLRSSTQTKPLSLSAWVVSGAVLLVDVVGNGALLAWMLG